MSAHCFQCYYTCKTCTGSNDNQCSSCYIDAELQITATGEKFCQNKNLIFKVFSSSRWYYILSIGFLVNTILIIVLLVYIYRRKNRGLVSVLRGTVLDSVVSPSGKGYRPVSSPEEKVLTGGMNVFHDDSSDDENGQRDEFVKPYKDNPNVKPYTDEV